MVKKEKRDFKHHIKADVIILGLTLPGIVTAHNLKKKFGDTMDVVVLDLGQRWKRQSKCNVIFQNDDDEDDDSSIEETTPPPRTGVYIDSVARFYLTKYAKDFSLTVPDIILSPTSCKNDLFKIFQYKCGSIVKSKADYHDFSFLNFLERFELAQYQRLLDSSMQNLFTISANTDAEKKKLHYLDQTTMEEHICSCLIFSTSREVMRTIVILVCGVPAENVSLLFYLHQCYRTNSSRNHVDGDNTRFREKLLGTCRKQLSSKLQKSIADITLTTKPIKQIRAHADEQVVLEPTIGETDYICNLVAMAIRPDQLSEIAVDSVLLPQATTKVTSQMTEGSGRKFTVSYHVNFWKRCGFSGDILSIRGPIIWAMERPSLSSAQSGNHATLIGYLSAKEDVVDSKEDVVNHLVEIFGEEAAEPISYKESQIRDIFIPQCGDYVALRDLTRENSPKFLEWGALDVFGDGDVAGAIEAGHVAYLHLLGCLRPQAISYDDITAGELQPKMSQGYKLTALINYRTTSKMLMYGIVVIATMRLVKYFLNRASS